MIGARHRFHGYGSLRAVYLRGQTVRNGPLTLKFTHRDRRKGYRVAVVVSRKVSKSAVVRNRIRRRIYELVRLHADSFTAPHDLVFTVYDESTAAISHSQLSAAVIGSLAKACVLGGAHNRTAR